MFPGNDLYGQRRQRGSFRATQKARVPKTAQECGTRSYNLLKESPTWPVPRSPLPPRFCPAPHQEACFSWLQSVDPKAYPKRRMEPRFVFNKIEVGDKVEFESAQFPNWYISTSQAEHLPVFLGDSHGQDIIDFTMEFVSS